MSLTNPVLPATMRKAINNIIGYARWNGIIDLSDSDIPVLVYADTTWNKANLMNMASVFIENLRKTGHSPSRGNMTLQIREIESTGPSTGGNVRGDDDE